MVAGLAWFAPPPAEEIVPPAGRAARGGDPGAKVRLSALPERAPIGEPRGDLFAAHSWAPAAQPAPASVAQPARAAPANPYRVAGRLIRPEGARVFLINGDRIYEAKPGDTLEGGYRVEAIDPGGVTLVYVPLGTREVLPFDSVLSPTPSQVTAGAPLAPDPAAAAPATASAGASAAQAAGSAAPVRLRWEGPGQVRAGTSFRVALHASSDQPLRATPMQLRFEPDILEALEVRAGKFFGQGSFTYRLNPDGSIFVGAAGSGAAPGADAELVVLTFRPRRAGTAQVSLASLSLQGAAGRTLAHGDLAAFRTAIQ